VILALRISAWPKEVRIPGARHVRRIHVRVDGTVGTSTGLDCVDDADLEQANTFARGNSLGFPAIDCHGDDLGGTLGRAYEDGDWSQNVRRYPSPGKVQPKQRWRL
jgi:hypothetical protein